LLFSSFQYGNNAMFTLRISKTIEKLRAGDLPPAPAVRTLMDSDKPALCSGCGEMIETFERYYFARIRKGKALRFHLICHEAWIRFKPIGQPSQTSTSLARS